MANPAQMYESYMVPVLFGPWAQTLVDVADPKQGERALDAGTGTGVVARSLAPRVQPGGSVTGIDPSPDMLEVARSVAGPDAPITWQQGEAEDLPFPAESFDLVTAQYSLMFFHDRHAALREMHRVLADQGRIAVSVWQSLDRHPFYGTLDRVIEQRLGLSAVGEIFVLGNEEEVHGMIESAGFRDIQVQHLSRDARFPDPEAFLTGEIEVDTAAIPSMQQLDDEQRKRVVDAIRDEMEGPLRAATEDNHVVLPFHANVFTARR